MPYRLSMPIVALALLVVVFANRDDGSHMPALSMRSDDRDLGVLAQSLRATKQDAPASASLRNALKGGRGTEKDTAAVRNAISYHSVEGIFGTMRAIEGLGPMFVELMTPEPAELEQCQWDSSMLEAAWDAIKDETYVVGLVLFNTAPSMPRLIRQMLRLVAMLPPASAFVSIYEMNSRDATGEWLVILDELLDLFHIRREIMHGFGSTSFGGHQPSAGDIADGIGGSSQMPNPLVRHRMIPVPLWLSAGMRDNKTASEVDEDASFEPELESKSMLWQAKQTKLVANGAFCAEDVTRLLSQA